MTIRCVVTAIAYSTSAAPVRDICRILEKRFLQAKHRPLAARRADSFRVREDLSIGEGCPPNRPLGYGITEKNIQPLQVAAKQDFACSASEKLRTPDIKVISES